MLHPRQKLLEIIDEATTSCRALAPHSPIIEREPDIRASIQSYAPTLMFYGHYNAGKSTLVNALLAMNGEAVANTGDMPCTDSVNAYDFGDYKIYDTPGLDAPVEHEAVSRKHLESTHVVVFVTTTSGNIDEQSTIDELIKIWESGRPLLVVLNDKQGHPPDSEQVSRQVATLYRHLERATGSYDIADDVDVLWVNAQRGWKARQLMASPDAKTREKGKKFWESSNIQMLEELMMKALMSTTGDELLRPALDTVEKTLGATIVHLETAESSEEESAFYRALKDSVENAREQFIQRSELALRRLKIELQGDLLAALEAGVPMNNMIEEFGERVGDIIGEELQTAQRELFEYFDNINQNATWRAFELDTSNIEGGINQQHEPRFSTFDVKTSGEFAAKYVQSDSGKKAIKGVLLKLREWKVPGFKGRWERTLGKWASQIGKGLGTAIQVGTFTYQIYDAFQAQQKAVEAAKAKKHFLTRQSSQVADDVHRKAKQQFPTIAYEAFADIDREVDEQLNEFHEQDRQTLTVIERLRELRRDVVRLQSSL